ncbi:putative leucine-rich repeat domain superfamily [Helianthus anomalus]
MMSRCLLNQNQLTGSIPTSIAGIYRLADLDLSMNKISGSIPEQIGSMPVLSTLNLDSNQLTDELPVNLLSNSSLNIVNLSRNDLKGAHFSNITFISNVFFGPDATRRGRGGDVGRGGRSPTVRSKQYDQVKIICFKSTSFPKSI